jgi:4-amino-4-deoxy-L-arabinose transferase-like glycosyltransferase
VSTHTIASPSRLRERAAALAELRTGPVLLGLLVLALAVRCAAIGSRLSIDDAYSWWISISPTAGIFLHRLAANENTPPLIYLVLMLVPGSSATWLRIPAAIPGALMCAVVYVALRPRLGRAPALIAALAAAVSPYLITYSNLARGFMLADLALLCAVWALLSLPDGDARWKWMGLFAACTVAVWAEYASVIFVVALLLSAMWIGVPRRRPTLIAVGLGLLTLAAWIPEIVRGQNQVGLTKLDPLGASPSLQALRDMFVTLTFGEHGGTMSSAGRWLLFVGLLAICGGGAWLLARQWAARDERWRRTIRLLSATGLLTVIGYALVAIVGVDVFTQRYITIEIPVVAALAGAAVAEIPWRRAVPAAVACLLALGVVDFAKRLGGEYEPSLTAVRQEAVSVHARTVLTNTPVVIYYLRSFHPDFDRPSNLGPGRAATCARPCLAVDDRRVHAGTPRPITGTPFYIGPFRLTLEP